MVGLDRVDGSLNPGATARDGRSLGATARGGLRRHWLFVALLLLGAALRGVVLAAYHPALIFPDSVRYLQYAHNFAGGHWSVDALRQSGYSVLIIPAMLLHDLWIIPLVQHLVGLATALLVYAVLIRFRTRTWLAAVATIPVLFDPLQLVLEQYALTDVWTVFLVLAALVILVWRRDAPGKEQRGWVPAAASGLLLGVAVTFRDEVLIMIVPAALYVLVAVRPRRRLLTRLAALAGCFVIPVAGYLGWFDASHGQLSFTTFSGAFLYGRVADFASCQGLSLPAYERPLCPTQPVAERNADFYAWNPQSPQWTFHPPAGMSRDAVVRDFSLRILRHQPLAYAEAIGRDFRYGFSAVRGAGPEQYSPAYLQFQTYVRPDQQAYASIGALGYPAPTLQPGLAAFLTDYGRWFYVPGPAFAAGLVLALAGLAVGRLRHRPVDATLLFTASAVFVLIPPAAFATFDWRYQLPQLSLIPIAAILGLNTIMSRVPTSSQRGLSDSGEEPKQDRPALPCGGHTTFGVRSGYRSRAERGPGSPVTTPASAALRTARAVVRAHWLFAVIFAAGLTLRVLSEITYRPALLYIDSAKYLVGSGGSEPEGYRLLLLDPLGGLSLVAAAQHAFGLATAVALYALLIRRGVPRWGAALTAAPVLLDAYQLQLEQTIMPDVLFETMVAAGLVLLLWRRRPGPRLIAAGALVLGAATTVREIGAVLIAPTLIFALLTAPKLTVPKLKASKASASKASASKLASARWRAGKRRVGRAALAGGCFALPVLGYMVAAIAVYGHFGLASNGPGPEYGRAAVAADCADLTLPADERALCPSPARTLALGGVDGLLHNPASPGLTTPVPAGMTREQLLGLFSLAVLRQQPLRVAASVFSDSVRLFALTRDGSPMIPSISRWQFQVFYPTYPDRDTMSAFTELARQAGSGAPAADRPLAAVLRGYQLHGGYTPGPLYAIGLAAGLLGALAGLVRRRPLSRRPLSRRPLGAANSELAVASLLVTLSAVVLLLSSDVFEFSWRYQLPAVVLLPAAGALGATAIAARFTAARTASGGTGRRTRPASAASGLPAPAVR